MGLLCIACVYILAYYSEANKGGRARVRLIREDSAYPYSLRVFVSRETAQARLQEATPAEAGVAREKKINNLFFFTHRPLLLARRLGKAHNYRWGGCFKVS
jgi:hypothetical protein